MKFSAAQIAGIIKGRIEGSPEATVNSFGKIEEAGQGQLSFLANPKYEDYLYSTNASIVIVNEGQQLRQAVTPTLIRVPDAYTAFATLLSAYQEMVADQLTGIQQPSYIASSAKLGDGVFVGAFAYVSEHATIGDQAKIFPSAFIGDNVTIGNQSVIHPGVIIYKDCVIGSRVTIHAGTVIGSDGFGFAPQPDGSFRKVPQIGNVVIEDGVEIGANTTIDRATIGSTFIRKGVKLDNLIQIAHNVDIGQDSVIAAQTGISGSTKLGKNVMVGGQVGIVGHVQIGDAARINAQSGVSKSIEPGKAVTGSPAFEYTAALRSQALMRKLPELERRIKELETMIAALKS
ncbi:MAG TPA: UDP-3-O-(3-hydroxymyristoyl)glucosamine N-acyltransferase [Chitinophagaceae bacterium]